MKTNTKTFALLAAVMLTLGLTKVNAQTPAEPNQDAEVTLNIKLHKIQSIIVTNGATVDLEYKSIGDYSGGVSKKIENHLQVFSTGGFSISAAAKTASLTNANSNEEIELSDITLLASAGENNNLGSALTLDKKQLSQSGVNVVESTKGGRNINFNVEYTAADDDKYINHYVKDENPTVYTTTVTYTISPK